MAKNTPQGHSSSTDQARDDCLVTHFGGPLDLQRIHPPIEKDEQNRPKDAGRSEPGQIAACLTAIAAAVRGGIRIGSRGIHCID